MNIVLFCENDISRSGLTQILACGGFEVVGHSDDISNLENFPNINGEDLVLIDCVSPRKQALTVELIMSNHPGTKVIVLADEYDMKTMLECFDTGAQGYIVKSMKSEGLIAALRLAALGEKVVPTDFVNLLGSQGMDFSLPSDVDDEIEKANLSPRELDVLCCLMAGYPNKVIARMLDVCEATVKVHVKAILRKLNLRNRTQAAVWAQTRKLPVPLSIGRRNLGPGEQSHPPLAEADHNGPDASSRAPA